PPHTTHAAPPPPPPPADTDDGASTAQGGLAYVADLERRLAPYFAGAEPRQRALAYGRGRLSPAERKNSWQVAEGSGAATPYGVQHWLGQADWEPEAETGRVEHHEGHPSGFGRRTRPGGDRA